MDRYSEIIKTRERLYRYDHENQILEELKKVIRKANIGGVISAVVQIEVVNRINLERDKFEENPAYWIDQYESANQ